LLELLIFLEQRDYILEARMEGVGSRDLVGDGFGATIGYFGFAGLFQFLPVGSGDVGPFGGIGERFEDLKRRLRRMS
jgi:hypothetical protein